MPRALLLLCLTLCASCAGWGDRRAGQDRAPEFPAPAAATPRTPSSDAGEASARQRLERAVALTAQTQALVPGWPGAESQLADSRRAIAQRDWTAARVAAEEALARADQAASDHYARLANEELARSYTYSGLDDTQLLQLRAAEEIMVTGNSRLAYGRLRMLNRQLEGRMKTYTVRSGDSLWVIAGKPEVYANSLLWPLVWQSNVAIIPDPDRLRRGQVLRLRPHPGVEEIAEAIDIARGKRPVVVGTTPSIGEIREAPP